MHGKMHHMQRYILTLSCSDRKGIVSAVTTALTSVGAFLTESAQFGDYSTQQFFMRIVFDLDSDREKIEKILTPVAEKFGIEWVLRTATYRPRVMIMVSKLSHCLNDLLHRHSCNLLPIEIPLIVSNHEELKPLAAHYQVPFHHLPITKENKPEQEKKLLSLLEKNQIDLVVLARYMQILSTDVCHKLKGKIINIHHSFLPSFKGAKPYHQAFDRGVKLIGATAHYVTADLDEGPIIEQEVTRVSHSHTPEELVAMGRDIECLVLARAVKLHIERRVLIDKNKTIVF